MTIKIVHKKEIFWWDFGQWSARSKFIVYRRFLWIFWFQIYWSWEEKYANQYADSYREMKKFNRRNLHSKRQ